GVVGEDISERAPCFSLDELRRRGKNSHPEKLAEGGEIRASDYVPRFADGRLLDFTDFRKCASRLAEHSFGEAQRPVARQNQRGAPANGSGDVHHHDHYTLSGKAGAARL